MSITSNLEQVRNELADAAARSGRSPHLVQLIAVSKTHPPDAVQEAYAAGQRVFGENRVQEAETKFPGLSLPGLDLHLIGPLQNNKTRRAAELFQAIDSLESVKTALRLADARLLTAYTQPLPVLLEVKLSAEPTKHGLAPEDLPGVLEAIAALPALRVVGLMTVPPFTDDPEGARPYFSRLRNLRDQYQGRYPTLTELSMGMSHDYVIAIEEGSTMIRVGTAIFGRRA
jgi:PLP dependent protein